ncbi:MAG: hypothetical protein CMG69_01885 [Candidatus Marinimicrobia bacterium]|nr:hypothetical protein [Candidatus Neomarinimicrobiota bacterium]
MKSRRITILFIPDSGERQRQFSLPVPIIIIITVIVMILFGGAFYSIFKGFDDKISYNSLQNNYESLLTDRLAVNELMKDLNRMKFLDGQIRKSLSGELGLGKEVGKESESSFFNQDKNNMGFDIASIPSRIPVNGYLTQKMYVSSESKSKNHYGIDISSVEGTPVLAAARGLVIFSGWSYDLGNHIILYHGDGYFTQYGHLKNNLAKVREFVPLGEAIAHVGSTGISSGPHLHFEIWRDGTILDPLDFFPQYKQKDLSSGFEK